MMDNKSTNNLPARTPLNKEGSPFPVPLILKRTESYRKLAPFVPPTEVMPEPKNYYLVDVNMWELLHQDYFKRLQSAPASLHSVAAAPGPFMSGVKPLPRTLKSQCQTHNGSLSTSARFIRPNLPGEDALQSFQVLSSDLALRQNLSPDLSYQPNLTSDLTSRLCSSSDLAFPPNFPKESGLQSKFPEESEFLPKFPEDSGFLPKFPEDSSFRPNFPPETGFLPNFPSESGFPRNLPVESGFPPNFPSESTFIPNFPAESGFPPNFPSESTFIPNFPAESGFPPNSTFEVGFRPNFSTESGFTPISTPELCFQQNLGFRPALPSNLGVRPKVQPELRFRRNLFPLPNFYEEKGVSQTGTNKSKPIPRLSPALPDVIEKRPTTLPPKKKAKSKSPAPRRRRLSEGHSPVCRKKGGCVVPKPVCLNKVFQNEPVKSLTRKPKETSKSSKVGDTKRRPASRRAGSRKNIFKESDYIREYRSEEELESKYRGIQYYLFDETEVMEAIAETRILLEQP